MSAPGAGRSLGWTVVIDGQANRDPVTDYALPTITNVTYPNGTTLATGVNGIRTDGNVAMLVTGV